MQRRPTLEGESDGEIIDTEAFVETPGRSALVAANLTASIVIAAAKVLGR
ncbi:hypothetical protein LPW26_07945 [Rhodopseudomonas sp. HC1]|nr:hypothetical protein [Rhodopseudomonas infernalis]MCG6204562.1 hypothetical protein [Rhodopseudomonas infernalis]